MRVYICIEFLCENWVTVWKSEIVEREKVGLIKGMIRSGIYHSGGHETSYHDNNNWP